MKNLDDKELMNVDGGAFHPGLAVGIVAGLACSIGVLAGVIRPLKCR